MKRVQRTHTGSRAAAAALLAAVAALSAAPVAAAPPSWLPDPLLVARNNTLSMDEAVERARRATGGRVLSARRVQRDGRVGYRVKVITPDGVVRVVYVDGRTGRVR